MRPGNLFGEQVADHPLANTSMLLNRSRATLAIVKSISDRLTPMMGSGKPQRILGSFIGGDFAFGVIRARGW